MKQYLYEGPVMEFERCITPQWRATTWAVSPSKAKSNLAFRFKKENGKATNSKISLPGKVVVVLEEVS